VGGGWSVAPDVGAGPPARVLRVSGGVLLSTGGTLPGPALCRRDGGGSLVAGGDSGARFGAAQARSRTSCAAWNGCSHGFGAASSRSARATVLVARWTRRAVDRDARLGMEWWTRAMIAGQAGWRTTEPGSRGLADGAANFPLSARARATGRAGGASWGPRAPRLARWRSAGRRGRPRAGRPSKRGVHGEFVGRLREEGGRAALEGSARPPNEKGGNGERGHGMAGVVAP
jgi:hypothetical protein